MAENILCKYFMFSNMELLLVNFHSLLVVEGYKQQKNVLVMIRACFIKLFTGPITNDAMSGSSLFEVYVLAE